MIKLPYIYFLFFLVYGNSLFAQTNPIQNINWDITDTKVAINYDLVSPDGVNRRYDIELTIELPETKISPKEGLSGVKSVPVGRGRTINWYYGRNGYSQEDLDLDGVKILLEAVNPDPPIQEAIQEAMKVSSIEEKPSIVPGLATIVIGGGATIFGFLQESSAKDIYQNYTDFTCDQDGDGTADGGSFSTSCWEETYAKANSKHNTAQALMIGGSVVVATGIFLLINRNKKIKKLSLVPSNKNAPYLGSSTGLALRYSF